MIAHKDDKMSISEGKAAFICPDEYITLTPIGTSRLDHVQLWDPHRPFKHSNGLAEEAAELFPLLRVEGVPIVENGHWLTHGTISSATDHLLHVHGISSQRSLSRSPQGVL